MSSELGYQEMATEMLNSNDNNASVVAKSIASSGATNELKRRRGRLPKKEVGFNPRLLLIYDRRQLNTDEVLTNPTTGKGVMQCGLCLAKTSLHNWRKHLTTHYGVGWLVGEKPLNVASRAVVLGAMTTFFKTNFVDGVSCRMCSRVYRSGLGLLLHIELCGTIPKRFRCENCGKSYTKSSKMYHLRKCRNVQEAKEQTAENKNDVKESSAQESYEAVGKYCCQNHQCQFTSDDMKTLQEHTKICELSSKPCYYCWICKTTIVFATEEEAVNHVIIEHYMKTTLDESADELEDVTMEADDIPA